MDNVGLLSLEQFQKLPMDDKLNLAKNDFGLFLHMSAREDDSNFLRNVKEVTKCSDEMAKKLLIAATKGEYSGFDPELKALSEKAARFVVTHEAGKKFIEWEKEEESEHKEGGLVRGSLVGLSHAKQVGKLIDHFEHGGSHYDAALALGASKEEARKIDEVAQKAKKEVEEKHAEEQRRIDQIQDEKLRKQEQEKLDRIKRAEEAEIIRKSGVASQQILDTVAEAHQNAKKSVELRADGVNAKPLSEEEARRVKKEIEGYGNRVFKGVASKEEQIKWQMSEMMDMKEKEREKYYDKHPGLREAVKEYLVKSDDKVANHLANALVKDKEVKAEAKVNTKKELSNATANKDSEDDFASAMTIPSLGDIKVGSLSEKKQKATEVAFKEDQKSKLSV